MAEQQTTEINPMAMSLDQLSYYKNQQEEDIHELNRQLEALVGAKNRYMSAKNTIGEMGEKTEGNKMLVPLNSSLYVEGVATETDKVIVELGTGYFVEKNIPDAIELMDRKLALVSSSISAVEISSIDKRKTLDKIVQFIQYKISLANQQRASSDASAVAK